MTDEPTMLFCVGATKAATNWLREQLAVHPDCHLRAAHELHYFDCVESGNYAYHLRDQRHALARMEQRSDADGRRAGRIADRKEWIAVLERKQEDLPAYLRFLEAGRGQRRLVADVTPAYALLPEPRLRAMARILPDVRFLYVLRDPVARLWSHVRMLARRRDAAGRFDVTAAAVFDGVIGGANPDVVRRGDYAEILPRLMRAVDPARLLVMVQDQLLTQPGFARLCGFLGIAPAAADFGRRVHEGVPLPMTEDQLARARLFLCSQYAYVERLLGALPAGWRAETGVIA